MKTTRTLIVSAALLIAATAAFALPGAGPRGSRGPETGERRPNLERMAEHLGLTQEQRASVAAIMKAAREESESLIQTIPGKDVASAEGREARRKAIREETRAKIAGVLTPEQRTKLDEARERMRGPAGEIQGRLEGLARKLDLSAEQRAAIRTAFEQGAAPLRELLRNEDLTRKEFRLKMEALREETAAKVRAELTPEQREKFDEIHARLKERGPLGGRLGGGRHHGPKES